MNKKINIIIVDDHEIFREGLEFVLKTFKDFNIIASVSNGIELFEKLKTIKPNIVITDIQMPEMNGIEVCEKISKKYPDIKVLALSMFGEEQNLHKILNAGANGFILKNIDKLELEKAIRTVASDGNYFSSELLPYFTQKFLENTTENTEPGIKITNREKEVLKLIAKGHTNKEIADILFISQRTVDGHRASLIAKTGSHNVINMLIYAIKNKIITI